MSTLSDNIVIIDYGMGNLRSVQKAFANIGVPAIITNNHATIRSAAKLVLPGVGAFKDAMRNLHVQGLRNLLDDEVLGNKKPFLGICLGMQLVASKSYEFGETDGLGWIEGEIVRFDLPATPKPLKIPHVGWNSVHFAHPSPIYTGIPDESDFYFVHSYHFSGKETYATGVTHYGIDFISSVQKENIFATQFHPEKSQTHGLTLLKNFAAL